jgi:predicted esterase
LLKGGALVEKLISEGTLDTSFHFTVQYSELRNESAPDRCLFLLHGYGERKERIMRKLGEALQAEAKRIIALNAPFPVPQLSGEEFREGYSWFFRSLSKNKVLIHPSVCESLFRQAVDKLGLHDTKTTVIGFSQGGYVMPYLAKHLNNLEAMIGISCGVHRADHPELLSGDLYIVHADKDSLSDIDEAEKNFRDLSRTGNKGFFQRLSGEHAINSEKIEAVQSILRAI